MRHPFPLFLDLPIQCPVIFLPLECLDPLFLRLRTHLLNTPLVMFDLLRLELLQGLEVDAQLLALAVLVQAAGDLLIQGQLQGLRILAQETLSL
jgi:hypothetical protein